MQAEMPKKYWRNLPEASLIPELIAKAGERSEAMVQAQASEPRKGARVARPARVAPPEGAVPPNREIRPGLTLAQKLRGRTLTLTLTGRGVTPALAAEIEALLARLPVEA